MEENLLVDGSDRSTAGASTAVHSIGTGHHDATRGGSHGGAPVLLARDHLRWFGLAVDHQAGDGDGSDDAGE